ncbi:MAG TPA: serine hydrolase [Gaiellaceae bacterium]|nr:serine hydrolase [Gaiellaceae bacterium]
MAAAERYAEARAGTITFAVVDEAGRLHGYHAREVSPSASVLKAMLLVAYLRRDDVRNRALEQWERDLLAPMIRRSDNAPASRMVGLVGESRLKALARAAGMEHFRLHWPIWGQSEITPRGQALFFHRIDRLVPPRHRGYALRLLATVVPSQRWGVGRVPHAGWELYVKGGWGSGTGLVDHQVALYRSAGERLSLALFTRFDPNHEYGKETLRGLAERLFRGMPAPGSHFPRAARVALTREAVVTGSPDCASVTIRPREGGRRTFASGAATCSGFELVSAGLRALWSWPDGSEWHVATADYVSATPVDLGEFDSSEPLGPLAGNGETLAYSHGGAVSTVGGPDCPVEADVLAVGGERLAAGEGDTVEILDPDTCAVERTLRPSGIVTAVALDDGLAVSLSHGSAGRTWLEWFRISTGERVGKVKVAGATLPFLSLREPWILYRTSHSIRVLATGSGRSWTVWHPARSQLGARLLGKRIVWAENRDEKSFLWALHLPA